MTTDDVKRLLETNEKLPHRAHQLAGVCALLEHPYFLLADEVGAGKSKQVVAPEAAITVLQASQSDRDRTNVRSYGEGANVVSTASNSASSGPWAWPEPRPPVRLDGTPLTQPPWSSMTYLPHFFRQHRR